MRNDGVSLREIALALGVNPPAAAAEVNDVHHDSRAATPGSVFVAISGRNSDGHEFAADAVARGAIAIIAERNLDLDVPELEVADSRKALARAAAVVHGHPSRALAVIGVTGTNGKTTVVHMIETIGKAAGLATGTVGTLGARVRGAEIDLLRTTPESSDLQRMLRSMADTDVDIVAIEVSSHAMSLHRVDEIRFRVAAFTNLSQDHLDFHGNMNDYFAAKARLFETGRADVGVINVCTTWGRRLAGSASIPITRVGADAGDEVVVISAQARGGSGSFLLRWRDEEAEVLLPLPGRFNIDNAAVAAASCLEIGIDFADVCDGLESVPQLPGRFESLAGSWPFHVVVDYAHTPEAVARAVAAAREISSGRVIAVLGAGGDRDADKRTLMGEAVAQADVAVITSDNPRSEDPLAIMAEVEAGVPIHAQSVTEVNRRLAIRDALRLAASHDVVLVLGKGHEQGQEFSDGRVEPFDDRHVAAEEWQALSMGQPS